MWAGWLPHRCRLGGIPTLERREPNDPWPTRGQIGYLTPAVLEESQQLRGGNQMTHGPHVGRSAISTLPCWVVPNVSQRGMEPKVAHMWTYWPHHPCRIRGSPTLESRGPKSEVPRECVDGLPHPRRLGGSPTLERREPNHKGPACAHIGYIAPTLPTSPLPLAGSPGFRARDKIKSGPHKVHWLQHPCCLGGSPTLSGGSENHKWPTRRQIGYMNPAVFGRFPMLHSGDEIKSGHDGRGDAAHLPTCGPLLILFPTLKRWGPRQQVM